MDRTTVVPFDAPTIHARAHHAELLAAADRDRRLGRLGAGAHPARRFVSGLVAAARATAAMKSWPDGRDGLRSAEHELAAHGVTWSSDPSHDLALARELVAARARRALALPPLAPAVASVAARPLTVAPTHQPMPA